jgi:hypothetical protein
MMMMAVVVFINQFETRRTGAEVKAFDHAHFLQKVHGTINSGQIALALGKGVQDFAVGERMRMATQDFQDGRARAGDFARLAAQPAGQRGHFLPLMRMGVRVRFHGASSIAPAIAEIK